MCGQHLLPRALIPRPSIMRSLCTSPLAVVVLRVYGSPHATCNRPFAACLPVVHNMLTGGQARPCAAVPAPDLRAAAWSGAPCTSAEPHPVTQEWCQRQRGAAQHIMNTFLNHYAHGDAGGAAHDEAVVRCCCTATGLLLIVLLAVLSVCWALLCVVPLYWELSGSPQMCQQRRKFPGFVCFVWLLLLLFVCCPRGGGRVCSV